MKYVEQFGDANVRVKQWNEDRGIPGWFMLLEQSATFCQNNILPTPRKGMGPRISLHQ